MAAVRAWNPEDDQQLVDLWRRRTPIAEMSRLTGRSSSAINNRRIRLKLPSRNYRGEPGERVEENSVRVYLPLAYMEALEKLSEASGKSKSSIVRDLVGGLVARRAA